MDAGRDLDALVAEKVMGWTDVRANHYSGGPMWYGVPPTPQPGQSPYDRQRGIALLPGYSTDIAAAWQVVEYLHTHGLNVLLANGPYDWWSCRFTFRSDGKTVCQVSDVDSAPLAICVAALRAVGHT